MKNKTLAILMGIFLLAGCGTKTERMSPKEFESTLKSSPNAVLVDVRTPEEVASGYIKGADKFININGSNFETEINALDKSSTYIMYCRSGARSGRAAEFMIDNGFTDVYNLSGGILNYSGDIAK